MLPQEDEQVADEIDCFNVDNPSCKPVCADRFRDLTSYCSLFTKNDKYLVVSTSSMPFGDTALRSFTGEKGGVTMLRVRGILVKGYVGFAEVRLPIGNLPEEGKKQIERTYSCKITNSNLYTVIVPNVAIERFRKYGFIANSDEELKKELKEWFLTNIRDVIKDVLKLARGG